MLLEEGVDVVTIIIKANTALLEMLDPVETCILGLRRKPFIYSTALYISHEHTWSAQAPRKPWTLLPHLRSASEGTQALKLAKLHVGIIKRWGRGAEVRQLSIILFYGHIDTLLSNTKGAYYPRHRQWKLRPLDGTGISAYY